MYDIVKVKLVVDPFALSYGQIATLVLVEGAVALDLGELGEVVAVKERALEKLYAYTREHELEQECDQHDVSDSLQRNHQTVHHSLEIKPRIIDC
jgi:hypothetical protein